MHAIAETLQGAYAFILIFQIVVVTVLFLTLLGLVVRRLRTVQAQEEIAEGIVSTIDPATLADLEALREKINALQAENEASRALGDENKTLIEKVRYLESKLLEYEILQEEIGTLSALKIENEKLKSELAQKTAQRKPEPQATPLRVVEGGQVDSSPADALLNEISPGVEAQGKSGPSS